MADSNIAPDTTHHRAALIAFALVLLAALAAIPVAAGINQRHALEMMVQTGMKEKNQGEWLQRATFTREGVLPVYGTSELTLEVKNRASDFFHEAPTGFRIAPVGAPGNTTILIAEKLAAVGNVLRGRKVVIMLSGSWFNKPGAHADSYAGNFSPLQAVNLLENDTLALELKKRFAARMAEFPATLANHSALRNSLESLDGDSSWLRWKRRLWRPIVHLGKALLDAEDSFATATFALGLAPSKIIGEPQPRDIKWERLLKAAEENDSSNDTSLPARDYVSTDRDDDATFVAQIDASHEWGDLALLLDTMKSYDMKAIIFSAPLDGLRYDDHGVSRVARNHYYQKLEAECADRGFVCANFSDHDLDPGFLIPNSSHYTPKGWLYVNRLLDDFYHDKIPPVAEKLRP